MIAPQARRPLESRPDVYSGRTPVLVRCGACVGKFGEALREKRQCPFCGSLERSA